MSELNDRFEQAQQDVKGLASRPSNTDLLELYALYKQASAGEAANSTPPGRFDFVGKAKYDAWSAKAGLSTEDAMQAYITLVDGLLSR
jgi:acyl-CoA-binding protein